MEKAYVVLLIVGLIVTAIVFGYHFTAQDIEPPGASGMEAADGEGKPAEDASPYELEFDDNGTIIGATGTDDAEKVGAEPEGILETEGSGPGKAPAYSELVDTYRREYEGRIAELESEVQSLKNLLAVALHVSSGDVEHAVVSGDYSGISIGGLRKTPAEPEQLSPEEVEEEQKEFVREVIANVDMEKHIGNLARETKKQKARFEKSLPKIALKLYLNDYQCNQLVNIVNDAGDARIKVLREAEETSPEEYRKIIKEGFNSITTGMAEDLKLFLAPDQYNMMIRITKKPELINRPVKRPKAPK